MRRESQKPFLILALNKGNLALETDIITGIGVRKDQIKPLLGVYTHKNGDKVDEKSYLVAYDDSEQADALVYLAKNCSQESVLFVDSERCASLQYIESGKVERLGIFDEVSAYTAKKLDAYTYDPESHKYYAC